MQAMMRYFCTFFDSRYLPKARALYESLERVCPEFRLYSLCLDDASFQNLSALALRNLVPVSIHQLEAADPELAQAKLNRSAAEYYFTCSPCFPLYVLNTFPDVNLLTSLDADLYFFDSPEPVFDELADFSIGLTGHRYARGLERYKKYGAYNVGWMTFRRDPNGLACLQWWRERCLEWCYDRLEGDRFADQKYLEQWPRLFNSVRVIQNIGVNVGGWNIANYAFAVRGGKVYVDNTPLVFFHFASVKEVRSRVYRCGLWVSGRALTGVLRSQVFRPYVDTLERLTPPSAASKLLRTPEKNYGSVTNIVRHVRKALLGLVRMDYVVIVRNRVL